MAARAKSRGEKDITPPPQSKGKTLKKPVKTMSAPAQDQESSPPKITNGKRKSADGATPVPVSAPVSSKTTPAREITASQRKALHEMALFLKQASETTRVQILFALDNTPLSVTEICNLLGQSAPVVSRHLTILRHGRIVTMNRDGKRNIYQQTKGGANLTAVLKAILNKS